MLILGLSNVPVVRKELTNPLKLFSASNEEEQHHFLITHRFSSLKKKTLYREIEDCREMKNILSVFFVSSLYPKQTYLRSNTYKIIHLKKLFKRLVRHIFIETTKNKPIKLRIPLEVISYLLTLFLSVFEDLLQSWLLMC